MRGDPVRRLTTEALRARGEQAAVHGQRCVLMACEPHDDAHAVVSRLGAALALPSYYGANLDALYDCLTDDAVSVCAPHVLLIENVPLGPRLSGRQLAALRKTLRDAVQALADQGVRLEVAFSVRPVSP